MANISLHQAAQASTDTSQSSPIREDCIKSVRQAPHPSFYSIERPRNVLALNYSRNRKSSDYTMASQLTPAASLRVCLQGHHRREHHVDRSPRQGLCRHSVAEEGSSTLLCLCVAQLGQELTLSIRTSSLIPPPCPTFSRSRPPLVAS